MNETREGFELENPDFESKWHFALFFISGAKTNSWVYLLCWLLCEVAYFFHAQLNQSL